MAELIARLVVRLVGRRGRARDFVADCCHQIDGRLRAGPPAPRPNGDG